jgi:AI-2 transport protein TqsA
MSTDLHEERMWLATVSLMVLASVALAFALAYTRAVMVPFVLAIFIAVTVSPIIDFQVNRWRFPPSIAIAIALVAVLAVLAILGLACLVAIQAMVRTAGEYSESFASAIGRVFAQLERWKISVDQAMIAEQLRDRLPSVISQTVGTAANLLSKGVLIAIFVVFLLAGRRSQAVPTKIYAEIESKIRRYVSTKFLISAVTGLLVWGALAALGLRMALLFGMMAFLLNFIPSVGSVIATLLPIPVAVAQFDRVWPVVAVVALPGAIQQIMGNVVDPKLVGKGMDLHPVTVLLALAFWGLLWGPIGMVLSVPITASIRIVLMRFDTTRPMADLLAGQFRQAGG